MSRKICSENLPFFVTEVHFRLEGRKQNSTSRHTRPPPSPKQAALCTGRSLKRGGTKTFDTK